MNCAVFLEDVDEQLVVMRVPKKDIVVGFHPSYIRQYTDYAVG
ncbi:element excision factor XisI family protein [uncultured Nostoc sp.]